MRGLVAALLLATAVAVVPAPVGKAGGPDPLASAPGGGVHGIDVSHHQGKIAWPRVARSGYRFAIAKATEGRTYVDRTYRRNKAQAEASGIAFGAYHFARPGRGVHDAVREANHFLAVARLGPGNLAPVLDLETTGGLSERRLTRWVLTWLRHVGRRLGLRPIVYTSTRGWAERTGDTRAVADAGFDRLWVAHWGVRRPSLPARDWGGYGWTLWQRDDCGRVPGIKGCVDVNRTAGYSLEPLTIEGPDPGPPGVRIGPPRSLTGPAVIRFDRVVSGVSRWNVDLRSANGTRLAVGLECRAGAGWPVDCATRDVRKVLVTPRRPLVPGRAYAVFVNGPRAASPVTGRGGHPAPATTRSFRAPTALEQGSAAIVYRRPRAWRVVERGDRRAARVAASEAAGASAEVTFVGTGVSLAMATGPRHGVAEIRVDGRRLGSVDTYARDRGVAVHRVRRLQPGAHTLRLVVLGRRSRPAEGTVVAVDRVRVTNEPPRHGGGQLPSAVDRGFPQPGRRGSHAQVLEPRAGPRPGGPIRAADPTQT